MRFMPQCTQLSVSQRPQRLLAALVAPNVSLAWAADIKPAIVRLVRIELATEPDALGWLAAIGAD